MKNNFKHIISNDAKKYLAFLQFERNLANNTITSYWMDLKFYIKYVLETYRIKNYKSIKQKHLTDYISQLSKYSSNEIESTTINRTISSIKGFHKYLINNQIMDNDPSKNISSLKTSQKLPSVLSYNEIELILSSVDEGAVNGVRDKSIISLLYSSGLRVSELITLNLSSLMLNENILRVVGKGDKERIVPVGVKAKLLLENYISNYRPLYSNRGNSKGIVYLSNRGTLLSRKTVWNLIKSYSNIAGINKKVTPHTFRHSFASHLIEGGADLRIVQELLGHSSISTTQIYTHLDKTYLKEIHKEFHPRG